MCVKPLWICTHIVCVCVWMCGLRSVWIIMCIFMLHGDCMCIKWYWTVIATNHGSRHIAFYERKHRNSRDETCPRSANLVLRIAFTQCDTQCTTPCDFFLVSINPSWGTVTSSLSEELFSAELTLELKGVVNWTSSSSQNSRDLIRLCCCVWTCHGYIRLISKT